MMKKCFLTGLLCSAFLFGAQAGVKAAPDSLNIAFLMREMENKVPLTYNDVTVRFINQYLSTQRSRFSRMLALSQNYFPLYERIFKDRNVPEELKYISVIESSLNPNAVSPVGAAGLWQFMPGTARLYGLTVSEWQDERKDTEKACNAAASFLQDSYLLYNDWLLAIASYNCGRNNIRWAMDKSGGKKTFWELRDYLPVETRNYVPAFIATAYIMANYRQLRITPGAAPPVNESPLKETVKTGGADPGNN